MAAWIKNFFLKKNRQQQEQQKANPKNPELHEEQGK